MLSKNVLEKIETININLKSVPSSPALQTLTPSLDRLLFGLWSTVHHLSLTVVAERTENATEVSA